MSLGDAADGALDRDAAVRVDDRAVIDLTARALRRRSDAVDRLAAQRGAIDLGAGAGVQHRHARRVRCAARAVRAVIAAAHGRVLERAGLRRRLAHAGCIRDAFAALAAGLGLEVAELAVVAVEPCDAAAGPAAAGLRLALRQAAHHRLDAAADAPLLFVRGAHGEVGAGAVLGLATGQRALVGRAQAVVLHGHPRAVRGAVAAIGAVVAAA